MENTDNTEYNIEEDSGNSRKSKWNSPLANVILFLLIATVAVTGYIILHYYLASRHTEEEQKSLKDMIVTEEEKPDEITKIDKIAPESKYVEIDGVMVLKKFSELYKANKDFIGWVSIEDTNIDCPVMYTPDDEEKYLRKNFEGEYTLAGEPFLSKLCDPKRPSTNLIIYGHNMYDGSMFADLMKYKNSSFYEDHKYIRFDTIYGTNYYEVIAFFGYTITNQNLKYVNFHNAWDEAEYRDYIKYIKNQSIVKTDMTANYEEKLITLTTCEKTGYDNGKRFMVIGKRIGE